MLSYPFEAREAEDETVEIFFTDFPFLSLLAPSVAQGLPRLERRLFRLIDAYVSAGLVVPEPSPGRSRSSLPGDLALKVRTYWNLEAAGTPREVLAGALGDGPAALADTAAGRGTEEPDRRMAAILALAIRAATGADFEPLEGAAALFRLSA